MAKRNRVPLQVSPKFSQKLKELQKKIRMKTGQDRSLRELTEDLVSSKAFEDIERKLVNKEVRLDIKLKFDRRLLQ